MRVGCARRGWGGGGGVVDLKPSFDGWIRGEAFNQDVGGSMIGCMSGFSPSSVTKHTRSVSWCVSVYLI